MARCGPLLTEAQWKKSRLCSPSRPNTARAVVRGSRTAGCWKGFCGFCAAALAGRICRRNFLHPSTCWRRLRDWEEQGVWLNIWRAFLSELNERQQLTVERIVSGRQFCSGEKRGCGVGKTKRGKGTKWMVVVDGRGIPLGKHLHSASPAEVRLAEKTLASIRVGRRDHAGRPRQKPLRVIADKAYDSDPLRKRCGTRIELICPHKRNRVRPATQDGRALRRYRRRWIVERTFAWLGNFRRLVVRYDRSSRSTTPSFISPAS